MELFPPATTPQPQRQGINSSFIKQRLRNQNDTKKLGVLEMEEWPAVARRSKSDGQQPAAILKLRLTSLKVQNFHIQDHYHKFA